MAKPEVRVIGTISKPDYAKHLENKPEVQRM